MPRDDAAIRSDALPGKESPNPILGIDTHTMRLGFDERAYLDVYDDVILALDIAEIDSAREHFERFGQREGRHTDERYISALGLGRDQPAQQEPAPLTVDAIVVSASGTALLLGWTDDRDNPIENLLVVAEGQHAWLTTSFGRLRRSDVETALGAPAGYLFGFWAVVRLGTKPSTAKPWLVRSRHRDGRYRQSEGQPRQMSDAELRDTILAHFATAEFHGNRDIESFLTLGSGIGTNLIELNRDISKAITTGAWVSTYGPERPSYDGSIIVCLFGKSEFLFVQSALFSMDAGLNRYEFVFVSNSPELTEQLQKEARLCARIYGVSIVLVCLPGNAGFGAANNIAAQYARSNRLLITNPDVFPRDTEWARRHTDLIQSQPSDRTRIFGAPLYYDDGSLMHHGMYFEVDQGTSVRPDGIIARPMVRVEHYGKGAPSWSRQFECPRPVPAVTGAFISVDRDWFETLGGFNEDYLFGHYEDADLSLRSLIRGKPVWVHDFPLWHLEGKGSVRRPPHEGGSMVNRWLFSQLWGDLITRDLAGPSALSNAMQAARIAAARPEAKPAKTSKRR
jgi:GT2 family glycosyltransferase